MKAVMYGAGNVGRGFIGQIFARSGFKVCFIDVVEPVVEALNREGRYPVRILGENNVQDILVEEVTAINGKNENDAAAAIAEADIMATAVGVRALPSIAPVIAEGLKKRFAGIVKPFNIIICENLIGANKELARLIKNCLSSEHHRFFDEYVGLVESSIGRMIPLQTPEMQDGNPLRVCVESYGFLPVDKAAFKGDIPSLAGMRPFDNFDFYIKRKLFIHNLGHSICAYLGMIRGDTFIYETVNNNSILFIAQNAMLESAMALSEKYNMPFPDLYCHIQDLLHRFSNKALGDTCARVGGDTIRKLGKNDRLIGAFLNCAEKNINPAFISAGIGAALYCHLNKNSIPQSRKAAMTALIEISELEDHSGEIEKILSFYLLFDAFSQEGNFEKLIKNIITAVYDTGKKREII